MDREKYVDESWKESAQIEKEKLKTLAGSQTQKSASSAESPRQSEPSPQAHPQNSPESSQEEYPESSSLTTNFLNHVSSIAYQAMIFLGEVPNPVTNLPETNLEQSKFMIDTLVVLREKTKGNLSKKEHDMLNSAIYQLQMKYVEACQREGII